MYVIDGYDYNDYKKDYRKKKEKNNILIYKIYVHICTTVYYILYTIYYIIRKHSIWMSSS